MDNLFIFRRFSIETTPTPLEGEHAALEQSGAAAPPSSALSLFPIRNLLIRGLIAWLPKWWHAKIWALPILELSLSLEPKDVHISYFFLPKWWQNFLPRFWLAKTVACQFFGNKPIRPLVTLMS